RRNSLSARRYRFSRDLSACRAGASRDWRQDQGQRPPPRPRWRDLLPVPEGFGFLVELLLPRLLLFGPFADERREHREMQQQPVHEITRETHRLDEIDEQHHSGMRRAVPGFVLIGVVENNRFAFAPAVSLGVDADTEMFARLR